MWWSYALYFSTIITATWGIRNWTFPSGFKFGVASAAYQVEGAWNVSDKTESIWDRFTHTRPDSIKDSSTGDVACDSYHNWRRDVEMLIELGVHFYRFSINWPRLLPQGLPSYISKDGHKYYSDLIDTLLEKGIEPVVTLYHWDLPQRFQDLGGWTNPLIADWFADYARAVFSLYGDRVKTWITINEPLVMCDMAYNIGVMAPGVVDSELAPYLCNKHILIAHAKAYRIYDKEFRDTFHGRVSLASQLIWFDPLTEADENLAEMTRLNMARTSHPIYSKEGGWPPAIEKIIAERSKKRGYPRTTLPPFTSEEIELVKGTYDFYAMNHYTSRVVRPARPGDQLGPWPLEACSDLEAVLEYPLKWNRTAASWFYVNPRGMRQQLVWLKKQYGNLEIFITENGFPTYGGLDDTDRIRYYRDNLEQVLMAISEDGVNVTGYTSWTLMDNFEWMDGYITKFGLYEVDVTSPQRKRTARASARYYASVIARHSLNVPEINFEEFKTIIEVETTPLVNEVISEVFIIVGIIIIVIAVILVVAIAASVWRTHRRRHAIATRRQNYVNVKVVE